MSSAIQMTGVRGQCDFCRAALFAVLMGAIAPSARPQSVISESVRRAVVDSVAGQIERFYVDVDTGRMIAKALRSRLAVGAFRRDSMADAFAESLSRTMRQINGDLHLEVAYAPGAPVETPNASGALASPGRGPDVAMSEFDEWEWRNRNYGFDELRSLDYGIAYWRITGFVSTPEAYRVAESALAYVRESRALVIDLREMPGGYGAMAHWLLSRFLGPDSVPILRSVNTSAHDTITHWTHPPASDGRLDRIPLYVLISENTASAGEAFAFVLKNRGRATLLGTRTAGAGHNVAFLSAGNGFVLALSYTRVSDPRTGREWERVGVRPDVETSPTTALAVAQAVALRTLARDEPVRRQALLRLAADGIDAERVRRPVHLSKLRHYEGQYGEREIRVRAGQLQFRRVPNAWKPLYAINDSIFALDRTERISILARGSLLQLVRSDGDTVRAARTRRLPP